MCLQTLEMSAGDTDLECSASGGCRPCLLDAVACHDSLKAFVCQLPAAFRAINVGALLQQLHSSVWGGGRDTVTGRERERVLHNELRDLLGGCCIFGAAFQLQLKSIFFCCLDFEKHTYTLNKCH